MTLIMRHGDATTFVCKTTGRSLTFAPGASSPTSVGFDGETHGVELLESEEAELARHPYFAEPEPAKKKTKKTTSTKEETT